MSTAVRGGKRLHCCVPSLQVDVLHKASSHQACFTTLSMAGDLFLTKFILFSGPGQQERQLNGEQESALPLAAVARVHLQVRGKFS